MFVFYHIRTGDIAFTISGESYPAHLVTETIGVIEVAQATSDLSGWKVVAGALVRVSIAPVKAAALAEIGRKIAVLRAQYLTDLPGQGMIYLGKEAEARAYLAASDPSLADYPMISAEVGVTAETAYQVAQVWICKSQIWQQLAAALEATRLTATNAIAAAADEAAVAVAIAAFEARLNAASSATQS
jgi:hypothetical protein